MGTAAGACRLESRHGKLKACSTLFVALAAVFLLLNRAIADVPRMGWCW
jgi:hypothetical protein